MNYVGALDAVIGRWLKRFTGKSLIALLMLIFGLMGTVYGTWEEIPAYALVIVPLFVAAGYDVMTGLAVLFVGATIVNDALSLGSGIFINRLSTDEFVSEFSKGATDLLKVVLVLSIAKGISVLMGTNTSGMSVNFVYWIQGMLHGVPA